MDLKYGKGVRVSAEDNPQLKLYSLGALALYYHLYDIRSVRMTICQPRLDNLSVFELSVDELIHWAEKELKPKAELAIKGEGEFCTGEHCQFCKVKALCRARAEKNLETAKLRFKKPDLLTDEEIVEVLRQVDEIKRWAEAVWKYAEEEAIAGSKSWDGYKVIKGVGRRRYTNEAAIAEVILATGDYKEEDIYKLNLLGIGDMETLLGKKQFKELLEGQGLVEKPEGKPKFVIESAKGTVWSQLNDAKAKFE